MSEEVLKEDESVPAYVIGPGECRVGFHPEADGMVLLAFPKNKICLAFKGEDALKLHDELCLALAMLGIGGEDEEDQAELGPMGVAPKPRMDN
jgi:hypothetical protein